MVLYNNSAFLNPKASIQATVPLTTETNSGHQTFSYDILLTGMKLIPTTQYLFNTCDLRHYIQESGIQIKKSLPLQQLNKNSIL
jgi:hypothetical protein